MTDCFNEADLPGSYQDADCASLKAQRHYLIIFRAMLVAMVLSAVATWMSASVISHQRIFSTVALVLGVGAFVSTFILKERKFEDTWYLGRAVAESVKTRAWSYMMAAQPYPLAKPPSEVDSAFIADIRKIVHEAPSITIVRAKGKTRDEITAGMRKVRNSSLPERMTTYLSCRIIDQRDWYSDKSIANANKESNIFVAVLCSQFVAAIVALMGVINNYPVSGSASVLATISSCFIAWLQVKKYQETAQAYSVASRELGLIAALAESITDEANAAKFVEESESAVSREHTLWIARRTSQL
ncbi:MAG TPA: DUF4231 domain-containing protein [Acidobacteriaceae bacterium]|jgi:hypothetical protein